jgi:hypothetical protein
MSNFLVTDRSGGNFTLSLSDGGSLPVQSAPGGSANSSVLIFPTIAAMAAFDSSSSTSPGQQAFVQSNGSLWSLKPTALQPAIADGITYVTGTPVQNSWSREPNSALVPSSLRAQQWFVDAQNVSGHASDENPPGDPTHPLATKAEVFRRWGYTWEPPLSGGVNVSVKYLSADLIAPAAGAGNDPALFAPVLEEGSSFMQFADPTPNVFTGTLLAVTAKNEAANTGLSSTVTTATGALVAGLLVVNTTRGNSRAWVVHVADGVFELSQPFTPFVPPSTFPVAVDTWANGDSIHAFAPLQIDMARVGGTVASFSAVAASNVVWQLDCVDASGSFAPMATDVDAAPFFVECALDRDPVGMTAGLFFTNVACNSGMGLTCATVANARGSIQIQGGYVISDGSSVEGGDLFDSVTLTGDVFVLVGVSSLEEVFVDATGILLLRGYTNATGAVIYGPGRLINTGSACQYTAPATSRFPIGTVGSGGGGMSINQALAYSNATSAGTVTVHRLTLTPLALDAAAGATGFGGLAYIPSVGSFFGDGAAP